MVVHRLELAVGDGKDIGHAGVNARDRIDPRLGFHDRGVEPGFERRRVAAFDDLPVQIQSQ